MFLSLHRVAAFPHQRCCLYIDQTGLMVRFFFFFFKWEGGAQGAGQARERKNCDEGLWMCVNYWVMDLSSLALSSPSLPPPSLSPPSSFTLLLCLPLFLQFSLQTHVSVLALWCGGIRFIPVTFRTDGQRNKLIPAFSLEVL